MAKGITLPGVDTSAVPPPVVCDSRRIVTRARRIALVRDAGQLALLASVDAILVHWPSTHVPLLARDTSIMVAALMNATVLVHVALCRWFPRWSAKRIASTWCVAERKRIRI